MIRQKKRYEQINKIAEEGGYLLNPDNNITYEIIEGLVINKERYGEEVCPCRLFKGTIETNMDIICPCYYRDDDLAEYGSCFCGLYVTEEAADKGGPNKQIPERRPSDIHRKNTNEIKDSQPSLLSYPVWRCGVCGYLCANTNAPSICPICKAKRERFNKFIL